MTKISYQVKIQFSSFTCNNITVAMATSVSANEIALLLLIIFRIHTGTNATNFFYFFNQNLNVCKIYIFLD